MKKSFIAIPSIIVITSLVYTLLGAIFLELDKVYAEGVKFVDVDDNNDNDRKMMMYSQQVVEVETPCKSPCPPNAEMCIQMSA
jgi:hypothetical protein